VLRQLILLPAGILLAEEFAQALLKAADQAGGAAPDIFGDDLGGAGQQQLQGAAHGLPDMPGQFVRGLLHGPEVAQPVLAEIVKAVPAGRLQDGEDGLGQLMARNGFYTSLYRAQFETY
jgi:hypothetical protein